MTSIYDLEQAQYPTQCEGCKKLYPVLEFREKNPEGYPCWRIYCNCDVWDEKNRAQWHYIWRVPCWYREEK